MWRDLARRIRQGISTNPLSRAVMRTFFPSANEPQSSSESKLEARLLLVSNRLPITIKRSEDGGYALSKSSGGLVSGLSGLSKATTFQWYGWPGLEVSEDEAENLTKRLKDEENAIPIFISDALAEKHYNGFSSQFPILCFAAVR